MKQRVEKIQEYLRNNELDGFLVNNLTNIRYLTGYTGSNALCYLTASTIHFFTDFRYKTQSAHEVSGWEIQIAKSTDLIHTLQKENIIRIGDTIAFEGNNISYEQYLRLEEIFSEVTFANHSMVIEKCASIKDETEKDNLRKAAEITDKVFEAILKDMKPGVSERDIAARISYYARTFGADGDSFPPVVASGENAAKPHHRAGKKFLQKHELIILDFGAKFNGYTADMTRTVCIGKADDKQKDIYKIVLDAQEKACKAASSNITGKELDAVARDYINDKGFGEFFGHGLGHGIGLNVHSWPRVNSENDSLLLKDQTVTIEPGIYLPEWGGVRIEDDIILKDQGCEIITQSPKHLIEL